MLKNKKILVLGFLQLMIFNWVAAQNPPFVFRHLTTSDGLASNNINCIIQDDNGFIWIATENGLQKYDGYTFTTYHHEPANPKSIEEDRVSLLITDPYRNILIKTHSSGFNWFDPSTGETLDPGRTNQDFLRKLDNSTDAFADEKGDFWFYSGQGFIRKFDPRTKRALGFQLDLKIQLPLYLEKVCYEEARQELWMATSQGIINYDLTARILYDRLNNPKNLPVFAIRSSLKSMARDKDENLWIFTSNHGFYRYNLNSKRLSAYWTPTGSAGKSITRGKQVDVDCFFQDRSGTIWLGALFNQKPALLRYEKDADSFTVIPSNTSDPKDFRCSYEVRCFCEDREGNIWIGTDQGINIFNPQRQKFFTIKNDPKNRSSLPKNEVTNFLQQKNGDIWVATWGGGIAIFDSHFRPKKTISASPGPSSSRHEWSMVWSLLENTDGKIWIGCQHGRLSIFDPATGEIQNSQPKELDRKTIKNMAMDKGGNIWMVLHTAIAKYDARSHHFKRYSDFIPYKGVRQTIVNDLLFDRRGNIWVATEGLGLQRFDPATEKFMELYVPQENDRHSLTSCLVNTFAADPNDSLIAIGTEGGGIDLFNMVTRQFYPITSVQGLPGNSITALYFSGPADLWVTTRNGLCKVNLRDMHAVKYGEDDGITNNEFSSSFRIYKLLDGHLLAGMSTGFIYFHPDSMVENRPPPDIKIIGFRVFDHELSIDSLLDHNRTILLSHEQNFITFRFASLTYLSPGLTNYYYQLKGVDPGWVNAGNQRFATYTQLKAGKYEFLVRSETRNGISSGNIATLSVMVYPAFWNTWWFGALVVLGIFILLFGLYRYRIGQLLQVHSMRNKISRDLHDDIGSGLSSINIYGEVIRQKLDATGQGKEVIPIITKIIDGSANLMENMQNIVWAINPSNDDLENAWVRMQLFATQVLEAKNIRVSADTGISGGKIRMGMEKSRDLLLIFKEVINNIAKHSKATAVSIRLERSDDGLNLHIEDNGIGFDSDRIIKGNGLKNIRERARSIHAGLNILSVVGKGTTVRISFAI